MKIILTQDRNTDSTENSPELNSYEQSTCENTLTEITAQKNETSYVLFEKWCKCKNYNDVFYYKSKLTLHQKTHTRKQPNENKNPGESSPVSRSSFTMRALTQVRSHLSAQNAGRLSLVCCIFLNMRGCTQARNCWNVKGISLRSHSYRMSKGFLSEVRALLYLNIHSDSHLGWASDILSNVFAIIHLPIALFSRDHPFQLLI